MPAYGPAGRGVRSSQRQRNTGLIPRQCVPRQDTFPCRTHRRGPLSGCATALGRGAPPPPYPVRLLALLLDPFPRPHPRGHQPRRPPAGPRLPISRDRLGLRANGRWSDAHCAARSHDGAQLRRAGPAAGGSCSGCPGLCCENGGGPNQCRGPQRCTRTPAPAAGGWWPCRGCGAETWCGHQRFRRAVWPAGIGACGQGAVGRRTFIHWAQSGPINCICCCCECNNGESWRGSSGVVPACLAGCRR